MESGNPKASRCLIAGDLPPAGDGWTHLLAATFPSTPARNGTECHRVPPLAYSVRLAALAPQYTADRPPLSTTITAFERDCPRPAGQSALPPVPRAGQSLHVTSLPLQPVQPQSLDRLVALPSIGATMRLVVCAKENRGDGLLCFWYRWRNAEALPTSALPASSREGFVLLGEGPRSPIRAPAREGTALRILLVML